MRNSKTKTVAIFNDFENNVRGLFSTEHIIDSLSPLDIEKYKAILNNESIIAIFQDEEMIHTIEQFFANSLNISQTSKVAFMHRNTLIYRLEKVKKLIGLDLKSFDDAVIFMNLSTIKKRLV